MTSPPVDFKRVFESAPNPYLLVDVDWRIVGVSDSYLKATMTQRDDIVGRALFDVFPDPPDQPTADGVAKLTASLRRVQSQRTQDQMAVQKYDIRGPGGGFVERWWQPCNTPVFDAEGNLYWILHYVEDVTSLVNAKVATKFAEHQVMLVNRLVAALALSLIVAVTVISGVVAGII